MIDIQKFKAVHFIGIGGIGVSALARMMLLSGKRVSGSDRSAGKVTDELIKLGVAVRFGHAGENIPHNADCVVYTNALAQNNPELRAAYARNIPVLSYPEMLGIVSQGKYTIAVSGTHGKTTTTAMIAGILRDGGLDPTVVVGSLLKAENSNFIGGKSDYFVVEADEYKKSFLHLHPNILVINNIDEDHLDFYKNLGDIQATFRELAERVPKDGYVICNAWDKHVSPVVQSLPASVVDYTQYRQDGTRLKVAGEHNRMNASAAYAVGKILDIADVVLKKSLAEFEGTWRRFEYKGTMENGAVVYDDYAHNPQKVRAALQGAREIFPEKRITVVFQPHLYSRTKLLLEGFTGAFKDADTVIITPIYAAREDPDPEISGEIVADAIANVRGETMYMGGFEEVISYLENNIGETDIVITMGAGDIFKVGDAPLKRKKSHAIGMGPVEA